MAAPGEAINQKRGGRRIQFGGFHPGALTRDGRRRTVASSVYGIGRKMEEQKSVEATLPSSYSNTCALVPPRGRVPSPTRSR
jgi:hypothetical protein